VSRFALPAIIALALATRLLLFTPSFTPDSERFLTQARHLLAHHGYLGSTGELEVGLPPGYPVFLAVLLSADGLSLIRSTQVILSVAGAILIWAALRPAGDRIALAGGLVFALHPWIASAAGAILSETLGAFVCSLLIYFLSKIETNQSNGFVFGASSVALILISPATIFLSFALFLRVLWLHRRSRTAMASTIAGALLLMLPWQAHAFAARNKVAPTVLAPKFENDIERWTRSWLRREREMWFRWHPRDLERAPRRAFRSEAERVRLIAVARRGTDAELARALRVTGQHAADENPLRYYLVLPAIRAAMLWTDMPQLGHAQMEYVGRVEIGEWREVGVWRASLRLAKGVVSSLAWMIYVGVPAVFLILGLRERQLMPMLIAACIAVYTLIIAYFGDPEARRNFVFYPALLYIPFYTKNRRRDVVGSDTSTPDRPNASYDPRYFTLLAQVDMTHFWFRARSDMVTWAMRRHFPSPEAVLEIGCGAGGTLARIRDAFPDAALAASDIYPEALPYAAERVPGAMIVQTDATAIPFEERFDVVVACDVIEHIERDDLALSQMYRAVRPGGGIVLTVPQDPRLWSAWDELGHHQRRYTRDELMQKVRAAGFTVERVLSMSSLIYPLMRLTRARAQTHCTPADELLISRPVNFVLNGVMNVERLLLRNGIDFPFGGSLLLVGRRG